MVFEGTNGYSALSLGWSTPNWFVQVALPFLVAVGVLLAGRGSLPAATEACGVLAGVVLSLVSQLIMSGLVVWSGDVGYSTGPGWWALLAGAVVLAGAVTVGVSRQPRMRDRPQLRRDGWAAGGLVVVLAGTLGSVLMGPVSSDYGWWQYLRVPELLLAACCLCLTGLRLSAGQRRLSLAAVTAFGAWLAEMAVEALTDHRSGAQPVVLLVSLLTVVLWVVAAYVVQMRPRAQEPRPVTTG
ncbi:MAG: hypothetical protein ACXVXA_19125 [Nocardioidaceae bacterium]